VAMHCPQPNKILRVITWIGINVAIFFAVAVTNGLLVYALSTVASCLFAAWMLTPFLIPRQLPKPTTHRLTKIVLVTVGTLCGSLLTYGHPFYLAVTIGVTIHAMRVLNRYSLGPVSAVIAPIITICPLILTSHASYSPLTLSSITYLFEAIGGYVFVVIALLAVIVLLKRDDWQLLPLIGKSPDLDGFENVGVPRVFTMHRTMDRGSSDKRIANNFVQKNFQIYMQSETVPPMQIQMIKGLIEWMAYPPKPDRALSSALDNQIFIPYPITAGYEGLLKKAIPELLVYLAGSDADWGGESGGDYQTIKLIRAKVRPGILSRELRDALQDTLRMMKIKFEDARNDPALMRRSDQALSLIRETLDEIAKVTVVASPVRQSTGDFSIGIATKANNIDEVHRLIKQGADVEALNELGATALINASQFGYTKIVKLLLENGANCNAATRRRTTSLHVSANHGHIDIVKMLIDKHTDVNATDATGATPLLYAVQSGKLEIVKIFMGIKGIDLNRSNENGVTPLIIASAKGHSEIVKALLSAGADVTLKDWNGSTAYDVSVMNGHKAIAKML